MTSAAAVDLPTLPTLAALRAAVSDGKTAPPDNHTPLLPEVLDILFEPSATLHSIAVPALVEALEKGDDDGSDDVAGYERLVNVVKSKLLALAETASTAGGGVDATAARGKLHNILGSHPRLGRKPVPGGGGEAEKLSALSAAEQGKMRAASSSSGSGASLEEAEKEEEELARLNAEYEARFPGLRYVTWVNGRPRRVILEDMRERIDKGDLDEEERRGVEAICDIAVDRAKKLLKAAAEAD
ncbi:hypothetical protein VTJ04DRAFT_33 [Mycothermus thermophilus]|uniref:uncharacterized protein n=1 Tax=Humicola insolens TaxID=85995 RepID=UPI003742DD33